MARGVFLADPSLNKDDVDVTASSELGRRAGSVQPFAGNSNLLRMSAIGDAGDDTFHDIEITGTQKRPGYYPLTAGGARQYPDPTGFATMATKTIVSGSRFCIARADDRLWMVTVESLVLRVAVWDGSAWTEKALLAGLTDASGGISASQIGQNLYIAVGNNTDGVVELYRFSCPTLTLGLVDDNFVKTAGDLESLALGSNLSTFVLLTTLTSHDVKIYFGAAGSMEEHDKTINGLFSATWSTGDDVRAAAISWNSTLGFVAAFRAGTGSPAGLKLARSATGGAWIEFTDFNGNVAQPTTTTAWGTSTTCGIALEARRVCVWRVASTNILMHWFNGGVTPWANEVDADGGTAVDSNADVSAVGWRGRLHFAWRSSSTQVIARKCNELTTTNTGYYRELVMGQNMFVAGLDDDTKTALFFNATGSITPGDKFRIMKPEYDYRALHVLSDFLVQVWRGEDGSEQTLTLDAGSGRAFIVDAIALARTNFPSALVEIDDDSSFGSPSTSQAISATVKTATVTGANRNLVSFADDTFESMQFAPGAFFYWVQLSTGIFRILNNTHNALVVDGDATGAAAAPVTIFADAMGYIFSAPQSPGRYLRITTPAVSTPDGFVQISRVLFGLSHTLARNFSSGFERDDSAIETETEGKSGWRFVTSLNHHQRVRFVLPWQVLKGQHHLQSIRGMYRLGRGRRELGVFWPRLMTVGQAATGDQPELYFGRFVEPLNAKHINQDFYAVDGLPFETEVE